MCLNQRNLDLEQRLRKAFADIAEEKTKMMKSKIFNNHIEQ